MWPSSSTSPDWERLVVSPSQAPTDRDLRKFSGSSTAVVNEVALTAPTPGTDIRIWHASLRRALATSCRPSSAARISTTAGLCALFCLWWRRCSAMSSRSKAEHWAQELEAVAGRIAPQFGRAEPRRRALTYLQGLLAPLERKNGWPLAEAAGDCSPHGMQEFLSRVHWDADAL